MVHQYLIRGLLDMIRFALYSDGWKIKKLEFFQIYDFHPVFKIFLKEKFVVSSVVHFQIKLN